MRQLRGLLAVAAPAAAVLIASTSPAQDAPVNGMRPADLRCHAIVNGTVVVRPGEMLEGATIIIRDGVIESVGDVVVPDDARVWDAAGLHVYPGLIDPSVLVKSEAEPASPGDHWSERITPELSLAAQSVPPEATRRELRELGFTAAAVYPASGIIRGSGAVVALADEPAHALAYRDRAAMAIALDHGGSWQRPSYPGSLMGAIALVRQTLLDTQWHGGCRAVYEAHRQGSEPPRRSDALAALSDAAAGRQPVLFEVNDEHSALRALAVAEEFDLDVILLGSGMEYRRVQEIAGAGRPVIVPLHFPDRPELDSLAAAERVSLREMIEWEQAPTNARRLADAGVTIALTTHRLKKTRDFAKAAREAIMHGLAEEQALAALTVTPARLLGVDDILGTVEAGKVANLVVVDGTLFDKEREIRDVWINGRRHEINAQPPVKVGGEGMLVMADPAVELPVTLDTAKGSLSLKHGEKKVKAEKVTVLRDHLAFVVNGAPFGTEGYVRFSGIMRDGSVSGSAALPDGRWSTFSITVSEAPADEAGSGEAVADASAGEDSGEVEAPAEQDANGRWEIIVNVPELYENAPAMMELTVDDDGTVDGRIEGLGESFDLDAARFDEGLLTATITDPGGRPLSLSAHVHGDDISGEVVGEGLNATFAGTRTGGGDDAVAGSNRRERDPEHFEMPPDELAVPLGAYGLTSAPQQQDVLIENAVIWTCGPEGIIEDGSMLVRNGRIEAIYHGAAPAGIDAERIDAGGRHVTPGLIDCHSHTGIEGGVNEWAQANTAEVRIGDVIEPDDINWYRQLAGGLTAANQLHGSANPIGGQNSVVKLRWGGTARDFRIDGAPGGIKFALGENVKRSSGRYPDTRMGVETFIRDAFTAAAAYREARQRYERLPSDERERTMPPRRDLELDALVEILEGERLVHCHSYRQDEILMLVRVADDFGFTIGTFQHVLEGYKVAEALAEHGAGASSFSDWWAYKMEVMDAIPHNGSLMTEVGVLVSFNSDSSELARRMNTEAAKAVRYGGMDPHEALKLVTINPAIQLGIGERTGSLEPGKDADFAIWSGDPLSTYTRCEQTWIEGTRYFDLEQDRAMRERDAAERQRLVQKILAGAHGRISGDDDEKKDGETGDEPAAGEGEAQPTPSEAVAQMRRWMEEQVRLGHDPEEIRPGHCGSIDEWWLLMGGAAMECGH